jgi:hypothetical protein
LLLMPLQFPSQERVSLCELLARRSYPRGELPGGHEHVRIEGAWTKPSAVYTWELADHLAEGFERAIKVTPLMGQRFLDLRALS